MPSVLRNVLAAIGGLIAAVAVVVLSDFLVGQVYPLPSGAQMADTESARAAIAAVPLPALIALVIGWAMAGGAGAFVAVRLSPARQMLVGGAVAGLLVLATIGNLASFPHPVWMWPASITLIPLIGWAGARAAS
jgi:hypothetical protein